MSVSRKDAKDRQDDCTAEALAEVLRRVAAGALPIQRVTEESWDQVYCGNVLFRTGTWEITFYNDCGELDYVDHATAPDGSVLTFKQMRDEGEEPIIDVLTADERRRLEVVLEKATKAPPDVADKSAIAP